MARVAALSRVVSPIFALPRAAFPSQHLPWCCSGAGVLLSRSQASPFALTFVRESWFGSKKAESDKEPPSRAQSENVTPHVSFFVKSEAVELPGAETGGGGQGEGWSEAKASGSEAVVCF